MRLTQREFFIAFTCIVAIIVILLSPDAATAILVVGLLAGLAAAYQAAYPGGRGAPPAAGERENYFTAPPSAPPGAPAPHAVASATVPPAGVGRYPGSIDIDEYESEGAFGHRDQTEGDGDGVPVGNPFNPSRVSYSPAADACIDDEANDEELDGDEGMVYSGLQRNDATRVEAGTMNRRAALDKYFREEVEEAEDRQWWGASEY